MKKHVDYVVALDTVGGLEEGEEGADLRSIGMSSSIG